MLMLLVHKEKSYQEIIKINITEILFKYSASLIEALQHRYF